MFQTLHATSQDGLSLEFVAATTGKEWNIQDARGGGLWSAIWDRKELQEGKFYPMCMKFFHFWSEIQFWSLKKNI